MTVRSTILGRAALPDSVDTVLATVPAGQTWIVKSAIVLCQEIGPTAVQVYIQSTTLLMRAWLISGVLATTGRIEWDGWVVALPGDTIHAFMGNDLGTVWVSGSKLMGVAP